MVALRPKICALANWLIPVLFEYWLGVVDVSIQDWGAIGEIVGAMAVILTLIYLTTQICQNTRQLRSEGHQGITNGYADILGQLLADDSLFKTLVRGSRNGKASRLSSNHNVTFSSTNI